MRQLLFILAGVLVLLSAASAEHISRLFDARIDYRVPMAPYGVCAADFNDDGNLDLVTGGDSSDSIAVLLGDGVGGFALPVNYYACYEPEDLVTVDLDGNNSLDVVTVSGNYELCWISGNGDGSFSPGVVIKTGVRYFSIGQFTPDSHPDLIITHDQWDYDSVSVLINNGDGTFADAVPYWFGMNARPPIVANFNGDNAMDFAVPRYMDTISVYYGNGDGTFSSASVIETGFRHERIAGGDCNRDGYDDLIAADQTNRGFCVYLGDGTGNLTFDSLYLYDCWIDFMTTGDINGDGNLDVAYLDDSLFWSMGTGNGTFGPLQSCYAGPRLQQMCLADINSDLGIDVIVTAHDYSGTSEPGFVSVLQGTGDGDFHVVSHMPVMDQVKGLAACDVDGDLDLDLLAATWWLGSSDSLLVYENDGAGGFSRAHAYAIPTKAWDIVPAELNGDSDPDLIITFSEGTQIMLLNGTTGTAFGVMSLPTVGGRSYTAFAGDLDTNGTMDIATVSATDDALTILLNNGSGTVTPQAPLAVGNNPRCVDGGDLDGDGDIDLIVTCASTDQIEIYLNDGDALFTLDTAYYAGYGPEHGRLFDLDNDSDLDMIATAWYGDTVTIFENGGAGIFSVAGTFRTFKEPSYIEALDIDNDGFKEVVVTNYSDHNLSLLFNQGGMVFEPMIGSFGVGDTPDDMVSGDFDGDGSPDLAVTNYGHGTISILANR